jgi:glycosyltransferase involved in cell wall biosynthesis
MKILFAITKSNFGGAQKYVYELASRYKELGHDVHVSAGGEGVLKEKLHMASIPTHHIGGAQRDIDILKEFRVAINLFKTIRRVKPDVLHLNSPKIGGLGALIGRLLGVKNIVYTNHGWPFNEQRPLWQIAIIKTLSWFTIVLNKKTIVLSKIEFNQVSHWPLVSGKVVVIPNGVSDFDLLSKEEAIKKLSEQAGIDIDEKIRDKTLMIGSIGELHKNKGYAYAIDGIKCFINQYPDTKISYIIIGEGEERQYLEKKIKEEKLESIVYLAGQVENAKQYLKAFDIFLISSVKEGLPYVLLEAGLSDIPVITTSVGGIPEVVENLKEALIIAPKRPQEIQNAIFYAMQHKEDLSKISRAFKNKVSTEYNFKNISEKILGLYSDSR